MNSVQNRLTVEDRNGVAWLVFDHPSRLNAITFATLAALLDALDQANDARAVVITGRGRAFSAGQDLEELAAVSASPDPDADPDADATLALYQRVTERLLAHPVPTVAAINGVAVGFGAEVSLACDIRIAADSARMGFVEVQRGLFQTNGVTWLLPRLIGHGRAADLLLTGDIVGADTLERWGLVSRRCSDADLEATALQIAEVLGKGTPLSRTLIKEAIELTWSRSLAEMMELEVVGMKSVLAAGVAEAGARKFLDS